MGRQSLQELQQKQLLDNAEIEECFSKEYSELSEEQKNELSLSLYQFTKLIYDSVK